MRRVPFLTFAAILLSIVSCRSSRSVEVTGRDSMRIEAVGKETASVVAPSRGWLWGVAGLMLLAAVILVRSR